MPAPSVKLSYSQLALLDWLCEADGRLFTQHSGPDNGQLWLYDPVGDEGGLVRLRRIIPRSDDISLFERLGRRDSFEFNALYRNGFLQVLHPLGHTGYDKAKARAEYEAFVAKVAGKTFSYLQTIYVPTDAAKRYWADQGRDLARQHYEARRRKADQDQRLVVIAATCDRSFQVPEELSTLLPKGFRLPVSLGSVRRAVATAVVTRQTASRLYVRDVNWIGSRSGMRSNPVQGNAPELYVSIDDVLLDNAPHGVAEALARIDAEAAVDLSSAVAETLRRIAPELAALMSRIRQQDAMRDDIIKEILARTGIDAAEEEGGPKP